MFYAKTDIAIEDRILRELASNNWRIAAERTGRRAHGIEIDPAYVDVAIRRWQAYTGKAARFSATGQSFEEIEEQRATLEMSPSGGEHIEKFAA